MEFRDYYDIMGVARDATQDDIKRSYRKLARKYHPDVSDDPDAETRFKEVGEAYEVLKDPEKRAAYDQLGKNWKAGQDFRPPPDWNEGFEFSGGEGFGGGGFAGYGGFGEERFSDFFETLFRQQGAGGGFQGRRDLHMHGEDRHARISIDLRDSYTGATRAITLHAPEVTADGHVITRDRTLNVKIPQGIRDGQKIRLSGQGGPGIGKGKAGDLFLEVELQAPDRYRVDDADVYLNLPVAPWEAALGATVKVPLPSGDVDLKIPANSNQGSKLRLKGKGIPSKDPGDLYVVLDVRLPPGDSSEARA
ncbi:MAG: DnaJ domain-containing protein, partial [Gammaproteobacteria bacterium]|nr:DnaJ domain-containing protein [Gammaproteobacteria bacterium]